MCDHCLAHQEYRELLDDLLAKLKSNPPKERSIVKEILRCLTNILRYRR